MVDRIDRVNRVTQLACALLLLISAAGCHHPDDYLLASQSDQVLNVTLSATTLPAVASRSRS